MGNGKWQIGNGKWEMGNGKCGNGKRKIITRNLETWKLKNLEFLNDFAKKIPI